jgi:hypothetical protein
MTKQKAEIYDCSLTLFIYTIAITWNNIVFPKTVYKHVSKLFNLRVRLIRLDLNHL